MKLEVVFPDLRNHHRPLPDGPGEIIITQRRESGVGQR